MDIKSTINKHIQSSFKTETGWGDTVTDRQSNGIGFAHVPARGQLEVLMLSEDPVSYVGHYHDGRMRPCTHSGCQYCAKQLGSQRRWVFAVYDCSKNCTRLLELGAAPAGQLHQHAVDYQGLLGLRFRFTKSGGTLRSSISIELTGLSRVPVADLPEQIDVGNVLRKIWTEQTSSKLLSS